MFEAGELGFDCGDNRIRGQGRVFQHNRRNHAFAKVRMRNAVDCTLGYAGDVVNNVLNLFRIDVVAACDNQIFLTPNDCLTSAPMGPNRVIYLESVLGSS